MVGDGGSISSTLKSQQGVSLSISINKIQANIYDIQKGIHELCPLLAKAKEIGEVIKIKNLIFVCKWGMKQGGG